MTTAEITEAKKLAEIVRRGPPSYSPEVKLQLRLADLLLRCVDRVLELERDANKAATDGR